METIIERADMFGRKWFMLFIMSILLLWTSSCNSKIEILNGENQVKQYPSFKGGKNMKKKILRMLSVLVIPVIFSINLFASYADELKVNEVSKEQMGASVAESIAESDTIMVIDSNGNDATEAYAPLLRMYQENNDYLKLIDEITNNNLSIRTVRPSSYGENHNFAVTRPRIVDTQLNGHTYRVDVTTFIKGSYYINNNGKVVVTDHSMDIIITPNFWWDLTVNGKQMGNSPNGSGAIVWYKYTLLGKSNYDNNGPTTRILANVYEDMII